MSSQQNNHGLGDVMSLLGGVNPVAMAGKAVETMVTLTGELVQTLANFNDTMRELNTAARRVNSLLDDIEVPIRAIVPQVQAGVKQARSTIKRVDGVLGQVGSLPADVAKAVSTLGDLAVRLSPLAAFAESAGGLFGMKPNK